MATKKPTTRKTATKKKASTEAPAKAPAQVGKYVAARHLREGGKHHAPGDLVEVTAERAKALGPLLKAK